MNPSCTDVLNTLEHLRMRIVYFTDQIEKNMKFRTNLKCDGCIKTVAPFLNALPSIEKWSVDLGKKESFLNIEGDVKEKDIVSALEEAGYKGERVI